MSWLPLTSGMDRSVITRSGRRCSITSRAIRPFATALTSYPLLLSVRCHTARRAASSSAITMIGMIATHYRRYRWHAAYVFGVRDEAGVAAGAAVHDAWARGTEGQNGDRRSSRLGECIRGDCGLQSGGIQLL